MSLLPAGTDFPQLLPGHEAARSARLVVDLPGMMVHTGGGSEPLQALKLTAKRETDINFAGAKHENQSDLAEATDNQTQR